jgi:hypothetical protein
MAKISAKNCEVLINGYKLSTYATAYEVKQAVDPVDVTGFTDGAHNFIPGQAASELSVDMLWSLTAGEVHTALGALTTGQVTLIPEGYSLGTASISMPFMQQNYNPGGKPTDAIKVGSIKFMSYGADAAIYNGVVLAHGTITTTTTGTGVQDPSAGAITAACGAVLHIWTKTLTDTYVVKVQHSTTLGSGYADLLTFSANGTALVAERQTAVSGTINQYRRIVATRTGAAADPFGFSVHFFTR